ncbi:anti-sigma factor family protein [Granulicella sibirica]|uniref:Putative zinc-finger domain-containing protein n=1 Tax=Granulicella sibirica TaxID=2479048 RepID=A0A4Q0SWL6_9BACT|nr:zf-HC2 domain-containing protein [Granulicella sibirica]RXH54812.1 hypothetical protein GRAN_3916 [Granulicella sibirica]
MNHKDAIQESSIERYILGELNGPARERFEDHLFDCKECADDLKAGVVFLEASRDELPALAYSRSQKPAWYAWILSPALLAPALAACLLVIGYDTTVVIPGARHEATQASSPAIINGVSLAAGTARSEDIKEVHAPRGGSFFVSFDIPAQNSYAAYVCSLYSPSGALVWHGEVTAEQAKDTVTVRIPSASTQAGINRLIVEGKSPSGIIGPAELSRYQFSLSLD